MNGTRTMTSERPGVEAPQQCPHPAACASLWRRPSLSGDDTHAVGCTAKVGMRARDTHEVWSNESVGCEPGPSTCARTRTRGEVKVRPRPLVNVNRREDKSKKLQHKTKQKSRYSTNQTNKTQCVCVFINARKYSHGSRARSGSRFARS